MGKNAFNRQIAAMRQSFFDEGILDEYFIEAEILSDDDPPFLEKLLSTYFKQSADCITLLEYGIESPSGINKLLEMTIYKLKGASASIGAIKVCKELDQAIQSYRNGNVEGIKIALEQVKNEHILLRTKLERYFQMKRQAGPSESAVRPK